MRWVEQIRIPLLWLEHFLASESPALQPVFTLDAHFRRGEKVIITTDASIYGLGAVLVVGVDHQMVAFGHSATGF